jgi:hypothetical protein
MEYRIYEVLGQKWVSLNGLKIISGGVSIPALQNHLTKEQKRECLQLSPVETKEMLGSYMPCGIFLIPNEKAHKWAEEISGRMKKATIADSSFLEKYKPVVQFSASQYKPVEKPEPKEDLLWLRIRPGNHSFYFPLDTFRKANLKRKKFVSVNYSKDSIAFHFGDIGGRGAFPVKNPITARWIFDQLKLSGIEFKNAMVLQLSKFKDPQGDGFWLVGKIK